MREDMDRAVFAARVALKVKLRCLCGQPFADHENSLCKPQFCNRGDQGVEMVIALPSCPHCGATGRTMRRLASNLIETMVIQDYGVNS